ncbi:MAG: IS3 family transposase [Phycisphaerae bacterium]|nr:IS3 family transposase [Phycisphaerae bacterium]
MDCSQRRACNATGTVRSSQRYRPVRADRDRALVAAIYEQAGRHPRYGYRMITDALRRDGWSVNAKRVYRLWRREGLKVARKARKQRSGGGSINSVKNRPSRHINDVWAMDFIHDSTASGGSLKMLVIEDEYTRECLALEVGASKFNGRQVAEALVELFAIRGVPVGIRSDNGSEFTGGDVSGMLKAAEVEQLCVEAGCPWENGMVESLNSILRDELLNTELFPTAKSARNMATAWRLEYNHRRGHGALGYQSPAEFAARCRPAPGSAALRPTRAGSGKNDKVMVLS